MLKSVVSLLVLGSLLMVPQVGSAKTNKRIKMKRKASGLDQGFWTKGENTVIQIDGTISEELSDCKLFEVKIEKTLQFNINCKGQSIVQNLGLKSSDQWVVSQRGNQMTITKYNYLTKKPQTSRLEKASLKIPYVEEIIHLKKQKTGELAFYIETFKVDEFGRIVQNSFIQVHGLANGKRLVSSFSK